MALHFCGACTYCFADLNSPNRTANIPQIMNMISGFRDKDTYLAKLLQEGYPVVMSNHVDVFSKSNHSIAMPIIECMAAQDIPIMFQTKAPPPAFTALDLVPPSVWYVTITTMDEEVRRRVEPGAPPAEDRLRFIEEAVRRGHRVTIGVNPCVDEWIGDPTELCKAAKAAGAEGAWIQPLHLSNKQIDSMPDMSKAAIGESVLTKARRKRKDAANIAIYNQTRSIALDAGLEIYDAGQKEYSKYFQPEKDVYKKLFPTTQDFVNYCYDTNKQPNDPIYWSEFRDFFVPQLPEGVLPLRNHLGAGQYAHFWKLWEDKIPKYMTYEELLWWCWHIQTIVYSPVNTKCFAWAAHIEEDSDGERAIEPYSDDEGLPIMLFRPEGTANIHEHWEAW